LTEFSYPGSSFVKVHFADFRPPPGVVVEVRNESGSESYLYSRETKGPMTHDAEIGDDGVRSFYAMSISGDTAIVEIHGKRKFDRSANRSAYGRVFVDHVVRGFGADEMQSSGVENSKSKGGASTQAVGGGDASVESTCGTLDTYDAVCWAGSDPAAYDRSRPVAKIVIGTSACTAWRVGPDNHLFTNNHCIANQAQTSAAEVWFNYERLVCGGADTGTVTKVAADQLISTDYSLDYSLFSVTDFASIETFGNLGLEVRDAILGEPIYLPQHGGGAPKQISIESDMNVSGACEVDDESVYGRDAETDIGYYCDTRGGSSGSPVVLAESNKAIALHHLGGCLNSGVKMSLIWKKVGRYFGRVVPEGDFDPTNLNPPEEPGPTPDPDPGTDEPPVAAFSFSCVYLECGFDGSGSSDPEGALAGLNWNFGDESTAEGVTVSHAFPSAGNYAVTLTVADASGNTDALTKNVSVVESRTQNSAPSAELSAVCDDLDCVFNGAASSDVDGSIVSYAWSFGDGASGNGVEVAHGYSSEGTFAVTLTVTDDDGATNSVTGSVTVQSAVVDPPALELTAQGFKVKGQKWADLAWSGAASSQVRILRDNLELAVSENSGSYRDESIDNPTKSAVYQVCELDGANCSAKVEVTF
jgi:PKD repeat protein